MARDADDEFVPTTTHAERPTPRRQLHDILNAEADERMMHVVLEHKQRAVAGRKGMTGKVWDAIALELGDDRLRNGEAVVARVAKLVDMTKQPGKFRHEMSSAVRALVSKYAVRRKHVQSSEPTKVDATSKRATHPSHLKNDAEQETSRRKRGERAATLQAASDELLARLVLKHRMILTNMSTLMETWQIIADALAPKFAQFKSGLTAQSRFEYLMFAYEHPTRAEKPISNLSLSSTMGEVVTQTINDQDRRLMHIVDQQNDASTCVREDTVDDLLLREILRSRPFHSKAGERFTSWNSVASRLKSEQFPCGDSCKKRTKSLLRLASDPQAECDLSRDLSPKQLVRLRLIDTAMSWHSIGSERLHHAYGELLLRVDQAVEDHFASTEPGVQEATRDSRGAKKAESNGLPTDVRPQLEIPQSLTLTEYERPKAITPCQSEDSAYSITQYQDIEPKIALRQGQLRVSQNKQRSSYIPGARNMVHTEEDSTREEHKTNIKAMIELMKVEREAHHREITAMIAMTQQDRIDRREEFLSLMDLVNRALSKATHPLNVSAPS